MLQVRTKGGDLRERSVSQLSGGERSRVSLALGLGFAELAAARGRLTPNLLVLDEVSPGAGRVICHLAHASFFFKCCLGLKVAGW